MTPAMVSKEEVEEIALTGICLEEDHVSLARSWLLQREAIERLRRGDCWCEMAVGNPMVKTHSEGCDLARALVVERGGSGK